MDEDPVDAIVDWQLSEQRSRRPPELPNPPRIASCPNCSMDWHGFRRSDCGGSHLTQEESEEQKGIYSHSDTPVHIPHWFPYGM